MQQKDNPPQPNAALSLRLSTSSQPAAMAGILEHPSLAAPAWLESLVDPLCTSIGFSRLASVLHIALIACAASFALQSFSHVVSPILFPKTYPKIRAKQDDWDLHVVSFPSWEQRAFRVGQLMPSGFL